MAGRKPGINIVLPTTYLHSKEWEFPPISMYTSDVIDKQRKIARGSGSGFVLRIEGLFISRGSTPSHHCVSQFLDIRANDVVQTVNEFHVWPSLSPLSRLGVPCGTALDFVDRPPELTLNRLLSTALRKDDENKSFTDHLERELAQHFALAAVQVCPVP